MMPAATREEITSRTLDRLRRFTESLERSEGIRGYRETRMIVDDERAVRLRREAGSDDWAAENVQRR